MEHKTKALTLIVGSYLSSDGFVSLLGIGALRTFAERWTLYVFACKDCVLVPAKVLLRGTRTDTSALMSPYHVVEMSAVEYPLSEKGSLGKSNLGMPGPILESACVLAPKHSMLVVSFAPCVRVQTHLHMQDA